MALLGCSFCVVMIDFLSLFQKLDSILLSCAMNEAEARDGMHNRGSRGSGQMRRKDDEFLER